jgi:NAD+ synthase
MGEQMDKTIVDNLIAWIKQYVAQSNANGVVIGMSGGKDSLVVAKLCEQALGKQNVFGVIMPNGQMKDFSVAEQSCKLLGIPYTTINIKKTYNTILKNTKHAIKNAQLSQVTTINLAPRIRMTVLYSIGGSLGCLVANTSNLSEICVGYTTKWGDNVGDFAPLANFTKSEVCQIGLLLGLPKELVKKTPDDGLSNKSDEEKLGFTYEELDNFIRHGTKGKNFEKILKHFKSSVHKRKGVESFQTGKPNFFEKL